MADKVSREVRSNMMRGIRGKDTRPEIVVRKYLFSQGFRYVLHGRNLPSKPDLVMPKYRLAVFVHGCFWHRHPLCSYAATPKTRRDFWVNKLEGNFARDKRSQAQLIDLGWRVCVVWECALRHSQKTTLNELAQFICSDADYAEFSWNQEPRTE
ncbi:very short patch repair endonuclease [Stenotrophomonas sp. PSU-St19]